MHLSFPWERLPKDLRGRLQEIIDDRLGAGVVLRLTHRVKVSDEELHDEFRAILDENNCTRDAAYKILAEKYKYTDRHVRRRVMRAKRGTNSD